MTNEIEREVALNILSRAHARREGKEYASGDEALVRRVAPASDPARVQVLVKAAKCRCLSLMSEWTKKLNSSDGLTIKFILRRRAPELVQAFERSNEGRDSIRYGQK